MPGNRSDRAPASAHLERTIGPWTLAANAVNLTVGAGIFALPAVVAAMLGPAAILAYIFCAALMLLVLACFVEVGSTITRSGGAVAYIEEAFGPLAGFVSWVVFALAYAAASDAAIAVVFLGALGSLVPALNGPVVRIVLLVFVFGGLVVINVRGVRQGATLSLATTVAKLVPLVLLIAVGAFAVHPANLAWHGLPSTEQLGGAALALFFAFGGAESALTPSGEVRDPARTVPRGIFGGIGALLLLYVGLQVVSQGVLGPDLVHGTQTPLAAVAGRVAGGFGRGLMLTGALVATFGTIAADVLCAPRSFLPVVERGLLPRAFGAIHPRYHTPWVTIVVYGSLGFVLAVSGGFRALAVLASMALLLVYLAVCLAALRLRYTRAAVPGVFRAPGGPLVAILGSLAVVWLLAHSAWRETAAMGGVVAASAVYYGLQMRFGRAAAVVVVESDAV